MTTSMSEALFAKKSQTILITGAAAKQTNKVGPAGIGKSLHRPGNVSSPAKFSGAAKVLDFVLIDKCVNAYEGDDSVYGEVTTSSGVVRFLIQSGSTTYEGERLHGFQKLIPITLYLLRDKGNNAELRDTFSRIAKDYNSTGTTSIADVLLFCDSLYYGYAKNNNDLDYEEFAFEVETAKAAIRSGLLTPMEVLKNLQGIPAITISTDTTIKKETKAKTAKNVDFEEVKSGKYLINFPWDESQACKIPSLKTLEDFVPSEQFYSLVRKINKRLNNVLLRIDGGMTGIDAIGNDFVNALVVGKPGTGKTTMAYALGAALGLPVSSVPLSKNTEEDTFQGMNKVVDGKITFVPTEALNTIKYGGILVLEEINLADPAVVMGSLGQAIEKPFILMEDGYKVTTRNPLCVVIGAMNVGTTGSKGVNQALSSRFKQTYMLNDPCKEDFINILMKQGHPKKACTWVYNVYEKIVNYLKMPSVNADDIALNVTLRGCLGALENIDEGSEPMAAVRDTLIGKIAEVDLELAEKVYSDIRNLPSY